MELTPLGKICVKSFNILLSWKGNNRTRLNNNIIKGKKEIMIKKAACAEKAAI
jgi:hypothetical protein